MGAVVLFEVYLYGQLITTVPGSSGETAEEIKWSLVIHDGYEFDIRVKKTRRKAVKDGNAKRKH